MYLTERIILGITWLACFVSLFFVPKGKRAQASFIFLLTQIPAWYLGVTVVEAGWLEYPVREFYRANSTSFSFEYLILPIICIFFNLCYPDDKSVRQKLIYYFLFGSIFTLFEFLVEKFTLLLKYNEWTWYWTWITVTLLYYFVRVVYKWFFRLQKPFYL